jgi:hypothetical protein
MGYFLTVFVLLIAAGGIGYVIGHSPNRPPPTAAATSKPAAPTPSAPRVIPANPVTEVPTPSAPTPAAPAPGAQQ